MADARLQREAEFHDQAFAGTARIRAGKFYSVAASAKRHYHALIGQDCAGLRVLEYGCGKGSHSFALARLGADVVGIDLSAEGIRQANSRADEERLEDQLSFEVMNAEALAFPDNHFDLVCGSGILHHLDLEAACRELVRVLKPEARAVFFEPLGHNPLINLYRRLTPKMRSEDEHPLLGGDLKTLAGRFQETDIRYFSLCTLLAVPFRRFPGFVPLVRILERIDCLLFRLSFMRRHAWLVVVQLGRPLKNNR